MKILTVGINHKTSAIETREKFYLSFLEIEVLLSELKNDPSIMSAIILSTCNRCEIYAHTVDEYNPSGIIKKLFHLKHQPQTNDLQKLFYVFQGPQALEHLLEVACGLDSLILGEKQILGQIKEAVELSRKNLMMDKTFNVLTNLVLETGKKARRETQIDSGGSSISWASVCMAQNILGSLQDKSVLILGSGKMGRLAVQQLANRGFKKLYIMNRTLEKAQELAKHTGAIAVPFWEMKGILPQVDACICCANCPHYLIEKDLVENTMRARNGKKLVLIDISVPRNIDPHAADVPGVFLKTVDDLDRVVQDNVEKRLSAAQQVEEIISSKVREFYEVMNKIRLLGEKKMEKITFFIIAGIVFWAASAQADMSQIKAYKEAFADTKPKCINCHIDQFPKKDGSHEPNDYGKAVIKAAGTEKPTADTYKKVGPIPAAK